MRSACWLTQLSLFFLVLGIQCRFSWLQASQALCHLTCFPGPGSSLPMAILGLELNTLWLMKSLRHRPPKEKTTFCQTISREKNSTRPPGWRNACPCTIISQPFTFSHVFNITRMISSFLNCVDPLWKQFLNSINGEGTWAIHQTCSMALLAVSNVLENIYSPLPTVICSYSPPHSSILRVLTADKIKSWSLLSNTIDLRWTYKNLNFCVFFKWNEFKLYLLLLVGRFSDSQFNF